MRCGAFLIGYMPYVFGVAIFAPLITFCYIYGNMIPTPVLGGLTIYLICWVVILRLWYKRYYAPASAIDLEELHDDHSTTA